MFPPTDYLILNPDDGISWEGIDATQRDGTDGQVAWFNNFDHIAANDVYIEDAMLTTLIDLTNATDEVLTFDLAYREFQLGGFGGTPDGLRLSVSTDCGVTFDDVLYEAFGEDLATVEPSTARFLPTDPSVWERKVFDISAYYGESVIFRFDNLSSYGNNIFIDNINVEFFELVPPVAQFSSSANGTCQGGTITFTNESQDADNYEWIFGAINNPSGASSAGPHTVTFFIPGINTVQLITSNPLGSDTFELEVVVDEFILASFDAEVIDGTLTVDFTNSSLGGTSFTWDFGDGNTSNEENPTHTYAVPGDYNVTLLVDSDFCTAGNASQSLALLPTSTDDLSETFAIQLAPNPNDGQFTLQVNADIQEDFDWKLTGVDGKTYRTGRINTNARQEIDVTNLSSGVFFLELTSGNQRLVERVMIMK